MSLAAARGMLSEIFEARHNKEVMLSLRSFCVIAWVLVAGQGVAKDLADYDSLRLVGAMREDERMLRSALAEQLRRTALSEQDMDCLDRFEYPRITDIVASEISARMT